MSASTNRSQGFPRPKAARTASRRKIGHPVEFVLKFLHSSAQRATFQTGPMAQAAGNGKGASAKGDGERGGTAVAG